MNTYEQEMQTSWLDGYGPELEELWEESGYFEEDTNE